jgi:hypothetical protein
MSIKIENIKVVETDHAGFKACACDKPHAWEGTAFTKVRRNHLYKNDRLHNTGKQEC